MKKLFAALVFFVFQMICSDIYGKEVPTTKSYYIIDGSCCGGEESDPHAVFGIEASDGYILLGKSLDMNSKEVIHLLILGYELISLKPISGNKV